MASARARLRRAMALLSDASDGTARVYDRHREPVPMSFSNARSEMADLSSKEPMTSRHRFRVASHSKSFTASGVMLLREQGRLRLDDPLGDHVPGLPGPLAAATVGQAMSHTAGLIRDGSDCAHWDDPRALSGSKFDP